MAEFKWVETGAKYENGQINFYKKETIVKQDKWITKWEYQLQDWKRQYAGYEAQIEELKDQIADIEHEQWHVSGKMRELKEKIDARKKANASLK